MTIKPTSAAPERPRLPPPVDALTRAFALLGKRWSGLVLAALAKGPAGFGEVRERVPGISDRMLADRLHELAAAGLLTRTVRHGPPVRSSYALTPHGDAFLIPLAALAVWAEEHLAITPTGTGGTCRRG
ncbi:winged helix-turn-helix transcriptional regulator [Streptomyces sp. NPDC088350]|uniref:winged helix-turn-helix transcriptional regulator n=1 Tax=Streptomyces sp. NPDC088350 TaxID=3365854 RepID=UPI0037F231D2